ncbi:hypothetical protein CY34DRAFT_18856 [Suillus luteus UH-Slu-Lm8-n1]|uniref:WD40 repeat-like protein n=1 Tax=Suillus luteus UH-Slu-Lm8-n1 TaxID=930992 RepID=A0A0D0AEQ2_9AGAM|nr:hypothetical protein CY34DRAFT_18856 [Suillus luteus UH-Slu-Lm8-n1]
MDGRRIVSGAKDGKIIIWDADTKEIIRHLSHHTDWVICIHFSPDEKRLASASSDGTLKIWDTETLKLVFDIDDHQDKVWTVAYSPDGTKIASGSFDCTPSVLNSHWSPDSCRLISGCDDGQIHFWSASTGAQLGSPLRGHSKAIVSLTISPDAFSPDGQLVATGSDDNMAIFLWDISQESTIMMNAVLPSSIPTATNNTSYIDQLPANFHSLTASSTPLDGLLDGTEFTTEFVGSRDAAASPSPSPPPQGHEIPTQFLASLGVELPDGIGVPPACDTAPSSSPSFPSRGSPIPK